MTEILLKYEQHYEQQSSSLQSQVNELITKVNILEKENQKNIKIIEELKRPTSIVDELKRQQSTSTIDMSHSAFVKELMQKRNAAESQVIQLSAALRNANTTLDRERKKQETELKKRKLETESQEANKKKKQDNEVIDLNQ